MMQLHGSIISSRKLLIMWTIPGLNSSIFHLLSTRIASVRTITTRRISGLAMTFGYGTSTLPRRTRLLLHLVSPMRGLSMGRCQMALALTVLMERWVLKELSVAYPSCSELFIPRQKGHTLSAKISCWLRWPIRSQVLWVQLQ